jgi:hypothetical protein
MKFQLSKSGTVTECREALNAAIAALPLPYTQEHAVVRAAAHYVVEENLDPLHDPWVRECMFAAEARTKGSKAANPPEPTTSFSIDIAIQVAQLKAKP